MRSFILPLLIVGLLPACNPKPPKAPEPKFSLAQDLPETESCLAQNNALALNEVQSVGSHNSYKKEIPAQELNMIRTGSSRAALELDYFHRPLVEQLDLGIRQLELDVFYDPEGGRYADPALPRVVGATLKKQPELPYYDTRDMDKPGFKTLHIQDIDVRSHCALFTTCLSQIKAWSARRPNHTPLLILINAKQTPIELPGAVTPLPFTAEAFDALDAEIRSVFSEDQLITPDDVRGNSSNLRGAVLLKGWPALVQSRGKMIFALDESPEVVTTYMRGKSSLEGHAMFVNTISQTADHAAYFTMNNPIAQSASIKAAVATGFLVRTRADADTQEARNNDTTRRDAALASGAQYVSTDYYEARTSLSPYEVGLPRNAITRCRP